MTAHPTFVEANMCGPTPLGSALVCGLQVDERARPTTRIDAARPYRMRFVVDRAAVFLAGIDPYWDGAVFARTSQQAPRRMPAIDAACVRQAAALVDADANLFWARFLVQHAVSVLHGGSWLLSSTIAVPRAAARRHPVMPDALGDFPPPWLDDAPWRSTWVEQWTHGPDETIGAGAVLAVRQVNDTSRLRWWRKCARRGQLPPLFTLFVPLLQKHVVLDGHLRWFAAVAEGVSPPVMTLWPTRATPRMNVEQQTHVRGAVEHLSARGLVRITVANESVAASYGSNWSPQLRAWPLVGGAAAWCDELRAAVPEEAVELLEALNAGV